MGAMQHCPLCPGTHQRSHWGAQLGAGRGARAGPHPACVSVPGELGGSPQRTAALGHLPLSGPSPRGSRRLLQHPRQPFLWGPVPPQAGSTHPAAGHEGVGSLPPPGWSSGVSTALCCPRGGWGVGTGWGAMLAQQTAQPIPRTLAAPSPVSSWWAPWSTGAGRVVRGVSEWWPGLGHGQVWQAVQRGPGGHCGDRRLPGGVQGTGIPAAPSALLWRLQLSPPAPSCHQQD